MNIYSVYYVIKHKRNGAPVFGIHSIIVAHDEKEAGEIYRAKHNPPTDKFLRVDKIGDDSSVGEVYSF